MKRRTFFITGGVFYALALAMLAPASLLDASIARATEGTLRLADVQGTVWSGTGEIRISDARSSASAGRVAWRPNRLSLVPPALVFEVEAGPRVKPFSLSVALARIDVVEAGLSLPARALGIVVPRLAALEPTGEVMLRVPHLVLTRDGASGAATIEWTSAGSALSSITPLGAYEMGVSRSGDAVEATLRTLRGPLEIEGRGGWVYGATPEFIAFAKMSAHEREIAPLLRLFAVEKADGRFELRL